MILPRCSIHSTQLCSVGRIFGNGFWHAARHLYQRVLALSPSQVEQYFKATAKLAATAIYWLGLYKTGDSFFWADGTFVGNGEVSEEPIYAHWWHT